MPVHSSIPVPMPETRRSAPISKKSQGRWFNQLEELFSGRPGNHKNAADFIDEAYRQLVPESLHRNALAIAENYGMPADARDAYDNLREAGEALWRGDYLSAAGHQTLGLLSSLGFSEISKPLKATYLAAEPSMLAMKKAIFAGIGARMADSKKVAKAERLAKSGADELTILKETGMFRGADGRWRFEIFDKQARIRPQELQETGRPDYREWRGRLIDLLDHPELFKAYPELGDMDIVLSHRRAKNGRREAYFDHSSKSGRPSIGIHHDGPQYPMDPDELKGQLLHELQHAVQWLEGFAPGGNLDSRDAAIKYLLAHTRKMSGAAKDLKRLIDGRAIAPNKVQEARRELHRLNAIIRRNEKKLIDLDELSGYQVYHRIAGEVEARNVASRRNLTPTQSLARPPWLGEEYPREMQFLLPPVRR